MPSREVGFGRGDPCAARIRAMLPRALLALALAPALAPALAAQDPTKVLVVYNANWPDENGNGVNDSLEVAQHFMARRGVPAQNLIGCACSTTTAYYYWQLPGWTAFWDEVRTPVVNKIAALGNANVDVILFCYGMPYQLELPAANGGTHALDDAMKTPFTIGNRTTPQLLQYVNPYYENAPGIPPDLGHFNHSYTSAGQPIWLVSRLDGLDADAAKDLVEGALYGERHLSPQPGFYSGYGYVDTRFKQYTDLELQQGYPFGYNTYTRADAAMAMGKFFVQASGYPLKWENGANDLEIGEPGALFHDATPAQLAPQAMFYGGWYNYGRYLDVWTWMPGSCAIDLNSNSLQGIRIPYQVAFLSQAFQRGLTCGTGCIAEPYLNGHPQPEKFLYFMLNGYPFAEAAMLSNPVLSWVNLAVGDPLYTPTKVGRQPILDTTPPPQPSLKVLAPSDTERTIQSRIDNTAREPEIVTVRLEYGATPSYGSLVDFGTTHRTTHLTKLTGLTADRLWHSKLTLKDPVGNTTTTPDFVFYTKAFAPALAGTNPKAQSATVPQPALVDLTAGHQNGFWNLTGIQVLLSAPHLGLTDVDVTNVVLSLGVAATASPTGDLVNLQVAFPTTLPSGTYTLKLRCLAGAAAPVEDAATITIP